MIVLNETTIFDNQLIDWQHFAGGYYKPSLKKASQKSPTITIEWGRHANCDLCDSPMPDIYTLDDDLVCESCHTANTVDSRIGKIFKTPIREFELKEMCQRGDTTYFKFNISTDPKKPLPKWYNATECEPCQ